ncbi:MAG: bifunctional folylpolyglutamate synthase/dihydrofolate synthase [Acidobacteria bacterium]|nr:bifunctional folylpolyglutamate synthase/dihydrofolate synthase [Acidobacteriota bacterium]
MEFREAQAYLDRHINHEARAGLVKGLSLDATYALLDVLAEPQKAYRVVHITGTNGKGTVAHLVSGLVGALGLHVGTYTSPHLVSVTERLRRNSEEISEEEFGAAIGVIAALAPLANHEPSYFEILTAAAFGWFAEIAVDVAVVEVGLLGRYDATNVVEADVAVITSIGRDHTDGAPGWERSVASEKAGIVVADRPLVIGSIPPELVDLFADEHPVPIVALGQELLVSPGQLGVGGQVVDITTPHGAHDDVFVPQFGAHQAANAGIAIAAVEQLVGTALDPEVIVEGFAAAPLKGRFEIVHHQPTVVIDGAHNVAAAEALAETLAEVLGEGQRRLFVIGLLEPRKASEMVEGLGIGPSDVVIACRAPSPRAVHPALIVEAAADQGAESELIEDVAEAVVRAITIAGADDTVVVCGSFYLYRAALEVTERLRPG